MKQPIKTAVILAGGEGTRLRPLTNNIPKPMVRVLGKPILQWVIEWLKNNEVRNIVIGVAYRKESVIDYFKDGSKFGVRIKYSVHTIDGETGEGFRLAIARYIKDDLFLAVNGDEMTNFNLQDLIDYHVAHNPVATIAVTHPRSPFGLINTDQNGLVQSFVEKPIINSLLVSIGTYLFSNRILDYLPERGSIEKTTFPSLANKKLLRAYPINGTWLTINTMKDLQFVEKMLKKMMGDGTWPEYL